MCWSATGCTFSAIWPAPIHPQPHTHTPLIERRCVGETRACVHCLQVGWIFNQSTEERDYIMHVDEVKQMASMQVCVLGCAWLSGRQSSA